MNLNNLIDLFVRDLNKLKVEIMAYNNEENLWKVSDGIANSGGNLCLHIVGNLNTYIGDGLANTGYIRDRVFEFTGRDVPCDSLCTQIDATIKIVTQGLKKLKEGKLDCDFPIVIWDRPTNMEFTLLHLLTHLNYHLGQVNYHRRLLEGTTA